MVRILTGTLLDVGIGENKSGRDTGDSESERPEEIWFSSTGEGTVFRPCFFIQKRSLKKAAQKISEKSKTKEMEEREEMKFISWNVNGIRACVQKGFMEFF